MTSPNRPRVLRPPGVWEALVLLLAFGMVAMGGLGSTWASLNGQDGNAANTWATFSLAPPGTITAAQSGSGVNVSWGASSNASSYLVQGGSAAKTASCASVTYSTLAAANSTTSFTDTSRVTNSAGNYFCYKVTSNDPSGWTSVNNPTTILSVGLWITSWSWANAVSTLTADCGAAGYGTSWGVAGKIDCGDTITVTLSAAVDQTLFTTANAWVCVFTAGNGSILLGDTTAAGPANNCATTDTYKLGQITSSQSGALGKLAKFPLYSVTWSGNQVVLTLGQVIGTAAKESSGTTWTLTPSTSLAAPSGGQGQVGCTVAACQATYASNS